MRNIPARQPIEGQCLAEYVVMCGGAAVRWLSRTQEFVTLWAEWLRRSSLGMTRWVTDEDWVSPQRNGFSAPRNGYVRNKISFRHIGY